MMVGRQAFELSVPVFSGSFSAEDFPKHRDLIIMMSKAKTFIRDESFSET
jgi:hypothetical protein